MDEVEQHIEFLPGFSACSGTKPGFNLENVNFSLSFSQVLCNGDTNVISRSYQCCYDWSPVMNIILEALDDFEDLEKVEFMIMEGMKSWFRTYAGWGLLSSLLDRKLQVKFLRSLQYLKLHWPFEEEEVSEEVCWEMVKNSYNDCMQWQSEECSEELKEEPFDQLFPHFNATVEEGEEFGGENGRKKWIKLRFAKKWFLEINFLVEKKKSEDCLVDVASKAVARMLQDEEEIRELEIPLTLRKPLSSKVKDFRWINSFMWNRKEEQVEEAH